MTATKSKWREIKDKCSACGHSGGYCTTDGEVIKCMRAPSDRPVKQKDGTTAYLHRSDVVGAVAAMPTKKQLARLTKTEIAALLKSHKTAVNPARLEKLAVSLGVSVRALKDFGVGYDSERGAWSFPMFDGKRNAVGIHLRGGDGRKRCVPGSQLGLFIPESYDPKPIPAELTDDPRPWTLLVPEGLTDAMAAFDFGLMAIGRPSNKAGNGQLRELLRSLPPQILIVIADNDKTNFLKDGTPFWPGIEGAVELAEAVLPLGRHARFFKAPDGKKDLREWKNAGGQPGRLWAEILGSSLVTPKWIEKAKLRLKEKKQQEKRPPEPPATTAA